MNSNYKKNREQMAFQLLNVGERFLDIGCGQGNLVLQASQKFEEVYGLDSATERIRLAQETSKAKGEARIYFQAADAAKGIPFDDAYFDAVSCITTLEHIYNPVELLKEVRRVLKYRGDFLVIVPNTAYLPRRFCALFGKPPHTSSAAGLMDGGTLHYFTLGSLTLLLQQEGFKIVKTDNIGRLWFLRGWWKSMLASGLVIKAIKP